MKVIIFGASSKTSIGYHIGRGLVKKGYEITYASRGGKLGEKCDINDFEQTNKLLYDVCPNIVIDATGVFSKPESFGCHSDFLKAREHLLVSSYGALVLADAAVRNKVEKLIMVGGRASSCNREFGVYAVANGSKSALVDFLVSYERFRIKSYYLDLPTIKHSTMIRGEGNNLYRHVPIPEEATLEDVNFAVQDILIDKYPNGSRVKV